MRQRARLINLALLLLALATPILFLGGYVVNGAEIFSRSTLRVVVALVGLSLGAGAAAYLALRRDAPAVRLVATIALVVLIGSVVYVRIEWGQSMSLTIEQLRREPFDANTVGVLVCPSGHSAAESREASDLQDLIQRTVAGAGLDGVIQVQMAQPLSDETIARALAKDRRASVVIWKQMDSYHGRVTETYHVSSYGLATNGIATDPVDLMLVLLTDETFTLERTYENGNGAIWSLASEAVAPLAIGLSFWPAGDPNRTATLIDGALAADGLTPAEQASLHEYMAATMLALDRPDLADQRLDEARGVADSARISAIDGAIEMARREWDAAEDSFLRAISLDPTYQPAYCGFSSVLAIKLDAERSIQIAQQAIALDEDRAAPYAFLGIARERSGDIDGAVEAYQRAGMLSGGNIGLYNASETRQQAIRMNPPTAVPTATVRPTPSITPYPTVAIHEVESGETLASIAEQYGVTIDQIMELNRLTSRNTITVGQRLKIPATLD